MESSKCPVCFDNFICPYILSCGHTFCIDCLGNLKPWLNDKNCPNCRQEIKFCVRNFNLDTECINLTNEQNLIKRYLDNFNFNSNSSNNSSIIDIIRNIRNINTSNITNNMNNINTSSITNNMNNINTSGIIDILYSLNNRNNTVSDNLNSAGLQNNLEDIYDRLQNMSVTIDENLFINGQTTSSFIGKMTNKNLYGFDVCIWMTFRGIDVPIELWGQNKSTIETKMKLRRYGKYKSLTNEEIKSAIDVWVNEHPILNNDCLKLIDFQTLRRITNKKLSHSGRTRREIENILRDLPLNATDLYPFTNLDQKYFYYSK